MSATKRRPASALPAACKSSTSTGRTVLPGLTDSHAHLADIGERELGFDLTGVESVAALQRRLAERAAADRSTWIVGSNWIESKWQPAVFPSRRDLDAVVSDRPVVLQRVDGHAAVANTKALEIAGIGRDTSDPPGGQILRDAAGEATGMLVDTAMELVYRHVPPVDRRAGGALPRGGRRALRAARLDASCRRPARPGARSTSSAGCMPPAA